ncbi:MAG: hypothetical protein IIX69_02930 [Clostridia bacterium]|nr:hypothetical protein [Clostridia bacterium]MBQ1933800.1 hypothetical protein [Clostridia bacterium]MBR0326819.1 hypothetical protein [Clostridia bacterium]
MTGDKRKARKLALNILDWLIIVALLLAGVGIWFRYGLAEKWENKTNTVTACISFSISNIKETSFTGGYFAEGNAVFNADAGNNLIGYFAEEEKFGYVPAVYYQHTKTGVGVIKQSASDRIDVVGAIMAEGIMTENGFFYGGTTYIAPGQTVLINTKDIKVSILITDIEIVESVENQPLQ